MSASSRFVRAVLLASLTATLPAPGAQDASTTKRVLVLYWYARDNPSNVQFDELFQAAMQAAAPRRIEVYSEYLESNRFPGENQSLVLRDYLKRKYADRRIDVVVAASHASVSFLLRYRDTLFADAPIVFHSIAPPPSDQLVAGPGATGIVYMQSHRRTLDLALKLHPGTKQVFVISGTANSDKQLEKVARRELQGYESRLGITYLTDLSLAELAARVRNLPEKSIILYIWQQFATQHGPVESPEILAAVAHSARVPIYGLTGSNVGRGIVGGYVATVEGNVTRLAELTLRLAGGARATDIAVEGAPVVPMFDWRQLQRWGIREDLLPPVSIVRFREPTMWQQYKWRIVAAIVLFILQGCLIAGLLVERQRVRRTQRELHEYKGQLEELVEKRTSELVQARDQALAANRSKSMFLAHMSHELRTPLNAILGFSGMVLRDDGLPPKHRQDLTIVANSGEHLLGLIDEVLDMAKIETGGNIAELASFDLHKLLGETVAMLRERAQAKNLALLLEISPQSPQFVQSDSRKLRQVLINLVGNALKYTDQGRIALRSDARRLENSANLILVFDVEDTGIGIAPDDRARIFEPFVQAGNSGGRKGTGLGLSISRHFVHLLGGQIELQSSPGQGSRFHLEIPALAAAAGEIAVDAQHAQVIGLQARPAALQDIDRGGSDGELVPPATAARGSWVRGPGSGRRSPGDRGLQRLASALHLDGFASPRPRWSGGGETHPNTRGRPRRQDRGRHRVRLCLTTRRGDRRRLR